MTATEQTTGWSTSALVAGAFGLALVALALVTPIVTMGDVDALDASVAMTVVGALLLVGGFRQLRKRRLIRNTPTSKVRALAVGDVEVTGSAHPVDDPLVSPLTRQQACLYEFEVQEKHQDDDGPDWRTVLRVRDTRPFELDDGTGRVRVDPEDADLILEREDTEGVEEREMPPDAVREWARETGRLRLDGAEEDEAILAAEGDLSEHLGRPSSHERRYTESVLAAGEETYVFGGAYPREGVDGVENPEHLVLRRHRGTGEFMLSDRSEVQLVRGKLRWGVIMLALALFLLPAGLAGLLTGTGLL